MIVVVLTACPVGLRGDLTRWLMEIAPDVFVGHVTARVREKLWERIEGQMRTGKAIMVYSARNEQHLAFQVHNAEWIPKDCEGLELMVRPARSNTETVDSTGMRDASQKNEGDGHQPGEHTSMPHGWSNASKYRKAKSMMKRRRAGGQ